MPPTRAIVLGAGMVGSVMAADLASDPAFDVTVADLRPANLAAAKDRAAGKLKTVQADLASPAEVKKLVADYEQQYQYGTRSNGVLNILVPYFILLIILMFLTNPYLKA